MTKSSIKQFEIEDFINAEGGFIAFESVVQKETNISQIVPHRHDFYCVSLLIEGKIQHDTDLENHLISAPAIILIGKEQVHVHSKDENYRTINLCFNPEFLNQKNENEWEDLFENVFIPLSLDESKEICDYFKLILAESSKSKSKSKSETILRHLVGIIFNLFKTSLLSKNHLWDRGNNLDLFYNFKAIIRANFRTNTNVKFYADKLNVTTDTLNKTVKKHSDSSPKELINNCRLTEAKRLLYWTEKSIKEISYELGFESDSYFNRFFKKLTGLTPSDFRQTQIK